MAEAFFNQMAPPGWRASSAGTEPGSSVRPEAVAVMREVGIDIAGQRPKGLQEALGAEVVLVVGLCREEACPVVPGATSEHWLLPDPSGREVEFFRQIRDELRNRIQDLTSRLA